MEGDGCAQQPTGACNLQPRPPPHVGKPAAHDQAAEDVHRARAEAPEEDEGEAVRAVLDEIADVFKGGEAGGYGQDRSLDVLPLRLEHQQIKEQGQQLHHLLDHRRYLRRGVQRRRIQRGGEEGVYIRREQAGQHTGQGEQERTQVPPPRAQRRHEQRRGDAHKGVFDIGHAATASPDAGSSEIRMPVSRKSIQKYGLASVSPSHRTDESHRAYSAQTKHSTAM